MITKGFVIPDNNNHEQTYEHVRTLEDIIDKDKAGMIFSPKVGLHENVAVLDYNDEFAVSVTRQLEKTNNLITLRLAYCRR
jgi:hypothetical protein